MGNKLLRIAIPVLGGGAAAALGAAAGWMAFSALRVRHDLPLLPALDAERRAMMTASGEAMSYYVDPRTPGRPLVLVHGVHAAASANDMRPIFERFAGKRPVYAPDLPGFGASERLDRDYTPKLYADAVCEVVARVRDQWGEAADVIALSLGCELAAIAAVKHPDLFRSLTMISPTGLSRRDGRVPENRARERSDKLLPRLSRSAWAQPLFDLLVARPVISHYLRKHFVGPIDDAYRRYAYLTAHRPGARHAPLSFLSGRLFTRDVRKTVYQQLSVPTLILYDEDPDVSFEALPELLHRNGMVRATRVRPTRGMPHFDAPQQTFRALDLFFRELDRGLYHERETLDVIETNGKREDLRR